MDVGNEVVERIVTKAAAIARRRMQSSNDGRIITAAAGRWMDEDDIAQEAALKAIKAARRYDAARGAEITLAYWVAHSTTRDVRAKVCSQRAGLAPIEGDDVDALLYGASSQPAKHGGKSAVAATEHAGVVAWDDGQARAIDAKAAAAAIIAALGPTKAATIKRFVAEGADGGMERRTGEVRLKDALCAARAVVKSGKAAW